MNELNEFILRIIYIEFFQIHNRYIIYMYQYND